MVVTCSTSVSCTLTEYTVDVGHKSLLKNSSISYVTVLKHRLVHPCQTCYDINISQNLRL